MDAVSQATTRPIKMIILCSPGNPTGTTIPLALIESLLGDTRFQGLLVVDEAYVDFAGHDKSALQLLRKGWRNLVVVQTLSKGFGLAGIRWVHLPLSNVDSGCSLLLNCEVLISSVNLLRLGIAYGSVELIQILNNTKAPYTISSPTARLAYEATLPDALARTQANIVQLQANRDWLTAELLQISGMGRILGTTEANFILIQVTSSDDSLMPDSSRARKVYKHMAGLNPEEAVVVRFRGDEPGCSGCLRITVGTMEECEKVVAQLRLALQLIS